MYMYSENEVFSEGELIAAAKSSVSNETPHTHGFIEIVYIVSGSGSQEVDGRSYPVSSGSLLFINYGQTHAFRTDSSMTYYNIFLKPEAVDSGIINAENAFEILSLTAFEDFRAVNCDCPLVVFKGEKKLRTENIVKEMYNEYKAKEIGSSTVLKGLLSVLLSYIFREMLSGAGSCSAIPPEIMEYIETHFNEKLSLAALSRKCFYSPKYFSRIFKERYGLTVTEYIQKKRIEEGCRLLKETPLSVDEISRSVGYGDNVSFYKFFKKICGITPSEYRKKQF